MDSLPLKVLKCKISVDEEKRCIKYKNWSFCTFTLFSFMQCQWLLLHSRSNSNVKLTVVNPKFSTDVAFLFCSSPKVAALIIHLIKEKKQRPLLFTKQLHSCIVRTKYTFPHTLYIQFISSDLLFTSLVYRRYNDNFSNLTTVLT